MNTFGNTPQEKAYQKLIHEQNSVMAELRHQIKKFEEWSKENNEAFKESKIERFPFFYLLELQKSNLKRLEVAFDEYYLKFKADFPQ